MLPDEPYITAQLLNWRRRLCDWRELDALAAQVRAALAQGCLLYTSPSPRD
uniref:Uncharacterized protein n=1 Tax=Ralstonia solanacearum TaxID=305 RepID=A0A0S4WN34_RALSL|nr:protein of unknown function [Ralstonia solanacearum]